ncbi:MAG: hypothetical protein KGQ36_05105 [Rickettsiales bacterium]|nr:hypothetical protein [Rickettsiales bacterium]
MIKKNKKIEVVQSIKEEDNRDSEYHDFVKKSVEDGSYFEDSLDWYCLRYVSPLCERTILIIAAVISIVVLFYIYSLVKMMFPLVQTFPITIKAKDQSLYFPHLLPLELQDEYKNSITVDEAIAKYLLSVYIKDREGYDYSKEEISDVNIKFNRLKNTSSAAEYKKFQLYMSDSNPKSPIYNFGKNVVRKIEINSVSFPTSNSDSFTKKAKDFLNLRVPTAAEVNFTATTISTIDDEVKKENENFVAKVGFSLLPISKGEKGKSINFMVNDYQLFKVQK